jgi:hypothetical protein
MAATDFTASARQKIGGEKSDYSHRHFHIAEMVAKFVTTLFGTMYILDA